MTTFKDETLEEKLEAAKVKKEELKEELKQVEKDINELEKKLSDEELTELNEVILTSGYTIKEVIKLIAEAKERKA